MEGRCPDEPVVFLCACVCSISVQMLEYQKLSLVPRPPPSFPSLAVRKSGDGKLGGGLGTRLPKAHKVKNVMLMNGVIKTQA